MTLPETMNMPLEEVLDVSEGQEELQNGVKKENGVDADKKQLLVKTKEKNENTLHLC